MNKNNCDIKTIFIAGHNGMVGRALLAKLSNQPDVNIITKTRSELDLTSQVRVLDFFREHWFIGK